MSLLTIVQDAAARVGVPQPSAVIGAADARPFLAVAQQEGKDLARRHNWSGLTKEKTFTSVAAAAQTSSIATDFDRIVNGTFFNRTTRRSVTGPLTAQEWQEIQGNLSTLVSQAYRIRGTSLLLTPTPSAGQTMAYEYISTYWLTNAGGTVERAAWTADDDISLLSEELITLGVVWRYLRNKGLDYGEAFQSYEVAVASVMGRDGGKRMLDMGAARGQRLPIAPEFPDGSWAL